MSTNYTPYTLHYEWQSYRVVNGADSQIVKRFLSYVDRKQKSGCWLWTGGKDAGGYGGFWLDGGTVRAHRLSYELFVGPIDVGLHVHHTCTNITCVNPSHLQSVTPKIHVTELTPTNLVFINAHKETCKNGHAFDEVNTYVTSKGTRECRACKREWAIAKRAEIEPKPIKTHCRRGHEYTDATTKWYDGRRYCKTCHAENTLRYYHEGRATNSPEWSKQAAKEVPLE